MSLCRMTIASEPGRPVLVLAGELDLSARTLIVGAQAVFAEALPAGIVLDLEGITFIDVAGLEVVFAIHAAAGLSPPILVRAMSAPVRNLVDLLEIGQYFHLEPT